MDTQQTARNTEAGRREALAAEERRLWLSIADPYAPPAERVKAYAGWLRITGVLRELGTAPEPAKRPANRA